MEFEEGEVADLSESEIESQDSDRFEPNQSDIPKPHALHRSGRHRPGHNNPRKQHVLVGDGREKIYRDRMDEKSHKDNGSDHSSVRKGGSGKLLSDGSLMRMKGGGFRPLPKDYDVDPKECTSLPQGNGRERPRPHGIGAFAGVDSHGDIDYRVSPAGLQSSDTQTDLTPRAAAGHLSPPHARFPYGPRGRLRFNQPQVREARPRLGGRCREPVRPFNDVDRHPTPNSMWGTNYHQRPPFPRFPHEPCFHPRSDIPPPFRPFQIPPRMPPTGSTRQPLLPDNSHALNRFRPPLGLESYGPPHVPPPELSGNVILASEEARVSSELDKMAALLASNRPSSSRQGDTTAPSVDHQLPISVTDQSTEALSQDTKEIVSENAPLQTFKVEDTDNQTNDSFVLGLPDLNLGTETSIPLKPIPWQLTPLDMHVKIPYPLMSLDVHDLPHRFDDPRLRGQLNALSFRSRATASIDDTDSITVPVHNEVQTAQSDSLQEESPAPVRRRPVKLQLNEMANTFTNPNIQTYVEDRPYLQNPKIRRRRIPAAGTPHDSERADTNTDANTAVEAPRSSPEACA